LLDQREKQEEELERAKEKIKTEKLINDSKISKRKVKTFLPVFLIGMFGVLYSLYDALFDYTIK